MTTTEHINVMSTVKENFSPKYKNLKLIRNSPKDLKDKMRKNYKDKIQHCRDILMDRFRGADMEIDVKSTLKEMYKDVFNFTNFITEDEEEIILFDEIKNELLQEEYEWWVEEYHKTHIDIDWSSLEQEDVICPVCQKNNLTLKNNLLTCNNCLISVVTQDTICNIKQTILLAIEKHSNTCDKEPEFTLVQELKESHIYLLCSSCSEMQIVV
ncbi:hypothetical protein ACJJTC_001390 [Scirpophaga incertulas]